MATQTRTTAIGWLRQKAAAAYIGISRRQFADYQKRGWVAPDAHLPSTTGGRPLPVYRPDSLDAAIARMNDPKARILSADAIRVAKRDAAKRSRSA